MRQSWAPPAPAGEGIGEENGPDALFSLNAIKSAQAATTLGEAAVPNEDAAAESPSEDEAADLSEPEDTDDERRYILLSFFFSHI